MQLQVFVFPCAVLALDTFQHKVDRSITDILSRNSTQQLLQCKTDRGMVLTRGSLFINSTEFYTGM